MRAKKIWILVVLVLVAIFGGRVWYLNKNKTDETNTVKIGAILPMTGILASNGESAKNAMLIAQDEFNSSHNNVKIQLVIEDGKFTAKDSISAARKLLSEGVDLIIPYGDITSKAILPMLREKNIPLLALTGSEELVRSYENAIGFLPDSRDLIGKSPDFIKSDLKMSDVAILYQHEPAIEKTTEQIITGVEQLGGNIVLKEEFAINSDQSHNIVAKVISAKPEVVIVFGWGPTYTAILNDLKQQQFKGPVITDNNIYSSKKELKENGKGIYVFDILFDPSMKIKSITDFMQEYYKKSSIEPDTFAIYSYETLKLVAEAIDSVNYSVIDVKNKILNTVKENSLVGPIRFRPDRMIYLDLKVKQLQPDGTAKIIKE